MKAKSFTLSAFLMAALTAGFMDTGQAKVTGQWDFKNGDLSATVGTDMTYFDGPGGQTDTATKFGTTTSFGIPNIDGQPAPVMYFPAATQFMGYVLTPGVGANGPNGLAETYSVIFDVLYPTNSDQKWRAFLQTDTPMDNSSDADYFVNPSDGIGISGDYSGNVTPNAWHRIVFVKDGATLWKYIDGAFVGQQTLDGGGIRWAFDPAPGVVLLFTDNSGDVAEGYVSSIQVQDTALSAGYISALGKPTSSKIPASVTVPAYVNSTDPLNSATDVQPDITIQAVIRNADTTLDASSVKLQFDDADVTPQVATSGGDTTVSFKPPSLLAPLSTHSFQLTFQDSTGASTTNTVSFTVADYKNIVLPQPIVLETFDEVSEGSLPTGWSVTNHTDSLTPGFDLNDSQSDAYLDWVVISSNRVSSVPNWNASYRLEFLPAVVNGKTIDGLIHGNFIYAESDTRGGNQVQALFSPDFDMTGHTNVYVSYHSIYTQNQDNIDCLEYSIDQGQSWLPVVYMIDQQDIVHAADGSVDAVATLNAIQADTAYGTNYGAYVAAPITPDLAPYISGRVNDDQMESKRVELFRLPQADNQKTVRFRFMQAGTASWYWGVDDFGLYSINTVIPPEITTQPQGAVVSAGSDFTLTVAAKGDGLTYQWSKDGNDIAGATDASLTLHSIQASDAGEYSVVVTNAGGSAPSTKARVSVFSGAITDNLVVHLPFDGNLNDTSGEGNNATAVASTFYTTGQIGQAYHMTAGTDYLTLGTPADLNFGTDTNFSFSFWAKLADQGWTGDPSFIGNKDWNSGGNPGYVIATDSDAHLQWNFSGPPGGRQDFDGPPGTFNDHQWHHVVMTFDRKGNATTYVDGVMMNATDISGSQNNVDTPSGLATNIGQDGTGNYGPSFTDAAFDDFGIWRRVLTPQEVTAIYQAGLNGKDLTTAVVSTGGGTPEISGIVSDGTNVTISWTGAAGVKLQKATNLTTPDWTDVAGTDGQSSYQEAIGTGNVFFRLIKQ